MDSKMVRHYETVKGEATRLSQGSHRVEFERTKEILLRYLSPPSAQILDLAGGPGVYSFWLADKSYKVHLVDIVPLHVEQAKAADSDSILASICQGDARCLDFEFDSMDVVLLLGQLYHLQERSDRIRALRATRRVLKKGGLAFCAVISRFASLLDGLRQGLLSDPDFRETAKKDLQDGRHINPKEVPQYFTTAYLHTPEELPEEIEGAGLRHLKTVGLEGPAWLLGDLEERWADIEGREIILDALRSIEDEWALMGVSAHILAVAQKV